MTSMGSANAANAATMAETFAADRRAAFGLGDVDALLAQYADDAIVISPVGVLRGRDQIKGMTEGIIAEFGQRGVSFELLSKNAVGPVVACTWRAKTGANDHRLDAEPMCSTVASRRTRRLQPASRRAEGDP